MPGTSWKKLFWIVAVMVTASESVDPRGSDHLARCIQMAKPLLQRPEFVFPLTIQDIRGVCRMWDGFVDCVNEFTSTYLTVSQKHNFNQAIRSSIESIHQLCAGDNDYQRSYVAYAPCLKRVSVEESFCGGQYQYLADLVQGKSATDAQLCCAHHKFRDCVLDKTPLECDQEGVVSGSNIPASRFMRDMLDRALGFLLQKCRDFVPNSRDCPRTNVEPSTKTPVLNVNPDGKTNEEDDFFIGSNTGDNSVDSIGNNVYLRPEATTSEISSTSPPASTTRFTWTTKASGPINERPASSEGETSVNDIFEPESQQYRGSGVGLSSQLWIILASFALARTFRLQ